MYLFSSVSTSVLEIVFLFRASFMLRMYKRTGQCAHAELFVAGPAPWEPILHLSVPHSRALILPQIYQQLTLFLSGIIDPIISRHRSLLSLAFSLTLSALLAPSLVFLADIHTHEDLSLLSVCSFTHPGTVTFTPTHNLSVMSLE